MPPIEITYKAVIPASPAAVYAILADFHEGHPAILPKESTSLTLREGGNGAGTVYDLEMEVMGVASAYRMHVSEPEPGRVMVEADEGGAVRTTITVEPADGGRAAAVTLHSAFRASAGLKGFMERLFQPLIVRRIYRKELRRLADYAAGQVQPETRPEVG